MLDIDAKGTGDLQGDARAANPGIAALEFHDGIDELLRWPFWAGRRWPREKPPIFASLECRRIIGFGVECADLCSVSLCRMFNQIIIGQSLPQHLSSDHDPLFRFHRWVANLRILEVEESKSYLPVSHPFVERLIGTIRRDFLDHVLIWNADDLERKLEEFRTYYNDHRVHQSLWGRTPGERSGQPPPTHVVPDRYA